MNKLRVRIISSVSKRFQDHLKKKRYRMIIFVYMNAVKYSALQHSNSRAQYRKLPSVRKKKCWSYSIMRQNNYVQETDTCGLIMIVSTRNQKYV